MEFTIIKTSNQKDKGMAQQKEGESKEESQVASTRNPKANKPPKEQEKDWRKTYSPSDRRLRIQKYAMYDVFHIARTLMEFKDKVK
ncbi:hypothetical protein O181_048805 [Austropuccinia psidii MF-1]|uniref:Uncharacterized protein n=1 Tax=Austropuccinia psidii MF-1 TaxID=1389203 RepID=A0A9Q3DXX3_9BASI|nr:hypothetical protein [Austropuccinia psidii MF-1]